MTYNLTNRQKDLLKRLVNGIREEGWGETFTDMSSPSYFVLVTDGGQIDIDSLKDMDVLVSEGLILFDSSDSSYTITQAAFDAVDNDFIFPKESKSTGDTNIGVQFIGDAPGGNIQGVGKADHSRIQQLINDPESLKEEIEKITDNLIDAVKIEISTKQLADYIKLTKEFKKELQKPKLQENKIKKLLAGLSFINDTSSSIELISKTLPYLIQLGQLIQNLF